MTFPLKGYIIRFGEKRKKGGKNIELFKKKSRKPLALLFVDYEHWYISMTKLHHQKPNLLAWREEVSQKYEIKDIYFFADYSHPNLQAEIPRIREVTNMVIETKNTSSFYKKDFTDFIVLDHIYQHAVSDRDVDCFIIFTGDGHFSSVVNFIRQRCHKEVGVYGVRLAMSGILKSAASWCIEIPEEEKKIDPDMPYIDLVLSYLKDRELEKNEKEMTLPETASRLKQYTGEDEEKFRRAANKLLELGYAKREETVVEGNRLVSILRPDWTRMKKDDYWDDELYLEEKK